MIVDKRPFSLLCLTSLLCLVVGGVPIIVNTQFVTSSQSVIENNLPISPATDELFLVPDSNLLLITRMDTSALIKAKVTSEGLIQELGEFTIGTSASGLHGITHSKVFPGKIWLSLVDDNKLLLIDHNTDSVTAAPIVLKEIDIPAPGSGPRYVREYGDELWVSLRLSFDVLRINIHDPSDYTIYNALRAPLLITKHPINKKIYVTEDFSAAIIEIDPETGLTKQIPITHGQTPTGIHSGPKGAWFSLLGNFTHGAGKFGRVNEDDSIEYYQLTSPLGRDAALYNLGFSVDSDIDHILWLEGSSLINNDATNMLVRVKFDDEWETIVSEDVIVMPTQQSVAHDLLVTKTNVFVTERTASKLFSYHHSF